MCEDSANLDKIYQYKISKICHICSNMHVLPEKRCCEARGCTNFQITDQLCNCKHIVCKILHITSGCFNDINQQSAFGYIYIAKVKAHDFYRWGSTSQWWRPHPIW